MVGHCAVGKHIGDIEEDDQHARDFQDAVRRLVDTSSTSHATGVAMHLSLRGLCGTRMPVIFLHDSPAEGSLSLWIGVCQNVQEEHRDEVHRDELRHTFENSGPRGG